MLKNSESVRIKKQYEAEDKPECEADKPHIEAMKKSLMEQGITIEEDKEEDDVLTLIDPTQYREEEIPEREWIIRDWLPRGHVSVLRGKRGVGKTAFIQQLATSLATGSPFLGNEIKAGRVYIATRENAGMWLRQNGLNEHYGSGKKDPVNIRFMLCRNNNNKFITFANSAVGEITEFHWRLYMDIMEYKPDLVILDSADDFFAGNEASHQQVRKFIQSACGKIACDTDAAVLVCVHDNTGSPDHTSQWYHVPRSSWYLRQRDEIDDCSYVLTLVKSNYAKLGEELLFYYTGGIFRPAGTGNRTETK